MTHLKRAIAAQESSPKVEALECRRYASCSVHVMNGTMTILGDSTANQIDIRDFGSGNVQVSCDRDVPVQAAGVSRILVDAGAGDDSVRYLVDHPDIAPSPQELRLDLAAGHDRLTVVVGNPEIRSPLRLVASGGAGADLISVAISQPTLVGCPDISVAVNGDDGNDALSIDVGDPEMLPAPGAVGDPDMRVAVNGGRGDDTTTVRLGRSPLFNASIDGGAGVDIAMHTGNSSTRNIEREVILGG